VFLQRGIKRLYAALGSPTLPSTQMPTFDMVVVGSGGGPDETDLSAYAISSTWTVTVRLTNYTLKLLDKAL
jgi:hypothetical protein